MESPQFDLERYRASMAKVEKNTISQFPEAVAHLKKCDRLILSTLTDLGCVESYSAAIHAHSLYLAACNLALGSHFSATFPLFRSAMESAVYGYLFNREPGLAKVWTERHDSDESFATSKKSFTKAIMRFRGYLQEHDKQSNGTPYEDYIMGFFDAAIDYGAHPNPIALTNGTTIERHGDHMKFRYDYLRTDYSSIIQCLIAAFDHAQIIAMINHFSRMFVNPEIPGLDDTFMIFVKETNAISDKLNGRPIGFEHRYYSRVNNSVRRLDD